NPCESASLSAFLIFYVFANCFLRNMPDGFNIIASRPQRWKPGGQRRKLIPQYPRSIALQLVYNKVRGQSWRGRDKQVYMIRHYAGFSNFNAQLISFGFQQLIKALFYLSGQHFSPVLGAENDVIAKVINSGFAGFPAILAHTVIIS